MSPALELPHTWRRDSVTVPRIWVAAALSVLLHSLLLWPSLPQLRRPSSETESLVARGPLTVELAPAPSPRTPPAASRPAAPRAKPSVRPTPQRVPRTVAPERPAAKPPVIALEKPAAPPARSAPAAAPPSPPRAASGQAAPAAPDLLAYVEAKRNARRESAAAPSAPESAAVAPAEDENARANRIAAANLGLGRKPELGGERQPGGGIFAIQRMGYDYAEFMFYGWNKEMRRNTPQLVEVRKGQNADIRIAIIRRMIAIIRDHEAGDFVWESRRLGRNVTLSARARDQAGLEEFLLREFFGETAAARR